MQRHKNLRDEKDGKYFVIAEAINGDIVLPLIKVSEWVDYLF